MVLTVLYYVKEKKMTVNLKNMKFSCIFLLLVFLMCLEDLSSIDMMQFVFNHVDEFIILLFWGYVLLHCSFL